MDEHPNRKSLGNPKCLKILKGGRMYKRWIIIFMIIILSRGCADDENKSTPTPMNPPDIETPSSIPIPHTPSPMPTATAEPTVTRTSQPSATTKPNQQCTNVAIQEIPFPIVSLSGSLALISSTHKSQESFLLNLAANLRTSLSNNGLENIIDTVISPDGNWLAYSVYDHSLEHELLLIVSSSGEVIKEINLVDLLQSTSTGVTSWLDDERLVGVRMGEHPEISPAENVTIIFNPFTGELSQYKSDFQDIYSLYPEYPYLWGKNFRTLSVYHPSLKLVIYKSFDGVVLWDLFNKQIVKLLPDKDGPFSSGPVWSRDGERFAIDLDSPTGRNLFLISTTGKAEQVTTFERRSPGDLMDFTWSPDGQSIAFWLSTRKGEDHVPIYDLTILNVNTQEVKSLCIHPINYRQIDPSGYIYWSPDGHELVVAAGMNGDPKRSESVLLDLKNSHAYKVADDVIPAGWLVNP
jgi:Tol biopolymer transport system component